MILILASLDGVVSVYFVVWITFLHGIIYIVLLMHAAYLDQHHLLLTKCQISLFPFPISISISISCLLLCYMDSEILLSVINENFIFFLIVLSVTDNNALLCSQLYNDFENAKIIQLQPIQSLLSRPSSRSIPESCG